jgi:hypothetical protein
MKFLKVLVNAVLCGLFFSVLLALLTFDININLSFDPISMGTLALTLAIPYGLIAALSLIVLFFVVQFFSGRKFRIKPISPSFLAAAFALLIVVFLVVFQENGRYFRSFFDAGTSKALRIQAIILGAMAVLAAAALYVSRRLKSRLLPLAGYFVLFASGLTMVIGQRAAFPPSLRGAKEGRLEARKADKNIILIGLEGLSFDFILPLISEGKLPNFSWLVENGSWGRLKTFSPTESYILDTSLKTGKLPAKHRRISLSSYRPFFGTCRLEVTPRFILFRQMIRLGLLEPEANNPPLGIRDIQGIVEANGMKAVSTPAPSGADLPEGDVRSNRAFNTAFKIDPGVTNRYVTAARSAFASDFNREESASAEKAGSQPRLFHLRLDGLNTVEAFFYKYSFPEQFGNIAQDDINRYGQVIARYYEYYDQLIGKYLAALKDNEILVIYSPYGVDPLPTWKRVVEWTLGNSEVSADHEDTPDGGVFFYGSGIQKRNSVEGMTLVDIAPTLLYYLGLPVGRDMDGIVQSPVFVRDFTAENPIFSISSYEEFEIGKTGR